MFKNQKGITLVALVITIIVLLILAGVSIAMISGDNGILTKASDAKVKDQIGAAKDAVVLAVSDGLADFYNLKYVDNSTTALPITSIDSKLTAVKTTYSAAAGDVVVTTKTTGTTSIAINIISKTGANATRVSGAINSTGTLTWDTTFTVIP